VPTHVVFDMTTNLGIWKASWGDCASRVCRIVQWFYPLTVCPSDTASAKPPTTPSAG
jgi:hypothetical protein